MKIDFIKAYCDVDGVSFINAYFDLPPNHYRVVFIKEEFVNSVWEVLCIYNENLNEIEEVSSALNKKITDYVFQYFNLDSEFDKKNGKNKHFDKEKIKSQIDRFLNSKY